MMMMMGPLVIAYSLWQLLIKPTLLTKTIVGNNLCIPKPIKKQVSDN